MIRYVELQELDLPPPPPLTDYERRRAVRVKRNNEIYFPLNLPTLSAEVRSSFSKGKLQEKDQAQEGSDEEYNPIMDLEAVSKDGGSGIQAKVH